MSKKVRGGGTRCTWCGKRDHDLKTRHRDAAGVAHWFHDACWRRHCEFARGVDRQEVMR